MKLKDLSNDSRQPRDALSEPRVASRGSNLNVKDIEDWLIAKLSDSLNIEPDQIDIREPFARFGLDSREAVSLSGELESWLWQNLAPTLVWDYPTIEKLACYLAKGSDIPNPSSEEGLKFNQGRDNEATKLRLLSDEESEVALRLQIH